MFNCPSSPPSIKILSWQVWSGVFHPALCWHYIFDDDHDVVDDDWDVVDGDWDVVDDDGHDVVDDDDVCCDRDGQESSPEQTLAGLQQLLEPPLLFSINWSNIWIKELKSEFYFWQFSTHFKTPIDYQLIVYGAVPPSLIVFLSICWKKLKPKDKSTNFLLFVKKNRQELSWNKYGLPTLLKKVTFVL